MACGTETLKAVNPEPIVQTFVIRKDPDLVVTFKEVDDLFILSSNKCPITKYSVTSSNGQPLFTNALKTIQIDEKERTITILNNIYKDLNVDLLLHIETTGGVKASKQVKLAFTENAAPKFKSKPKKISLEVIGDDIKKKKKDVFEYTSESATDAEKDKITFRFSGLNKIKCNCVTIKQVDDKFEVKIDKKRITEEDVGTYKIKVEIEDASYYYSKNKASEELEIQIEYQPETEVRRQQLRKRLTQIIQQQRMQLELEMLLREPAIQLQETRVLLIIRRLQVTPQLTRTIPLELITQQILIHQQIKRQILQQLRILDQLQF